ncbi:MAG: hypothetical protein KGH94_03000 [Candidatus Micrarchaeota archaeon]|nr:hypothetical protein [Candidatus Micrarchaeota archaeon]
MPLNVIENRQLLYIITMFLIVQFTGLLLASQIFPSFSFAPQQITSQNLVEYSIVVVLELTAILAIIMVLLKLIKLEVLFLLFEIGIVGYTSFIFFLIVSSIASGNASLSVAVLFSTAPFGKSAPMILAISLLCAAGMVIAKFKWPKMLNMTSMIASISIGLVLGLLVPFWLAFCFMIGLAVYDLIAVFVTKHMIVLANAAMSRNLSLMIMASEVEAVPSSYLGKKDRIEYSKAKKEIYSKNPLIRPVMDSGMVPLSARTALGTGDLMAPLMVAVSAYTVYLNFTLSIVVAIGAVLGLGLTMYTLKKYKRPLPAIPFLLSGITVALGAFFLISAL